MLSVERAFLSRTCACSNHRHYPQPSARPTPPCAVTVCKRLIYLSTVSRQYADFHEPLQRAVRAAHQLYSCLTSLATMGSQQPQKAQALPNPYGLPNPYAQPSLPNPYSTATVASSAPVKFTEEQDAMLKGLQDHSVGVEREAAETTEQVRELQQKIASIKCVVNPYSLYPKLVFISNL